MILYSKDEGFIKPRGIKNKDGIHDSSIVLPHIAVGVFSEHLLNDIVEKYRQSEIERLKAENKAIMQQMYCSVVRKEK